MNEATLNIYLQTLLLSQMKIYWKELEQRAIATGWPPSHFLHELSVN